MIVTCAALVNYGKFRGRRLFFVEGVGLAEDGRSATVAIKTLRPSISTFLLCTETLLLSQLRARQVPSLKQRTRNRRRAVVRMNENNLLVVSVTNHTMLKKFQVFSLHVYTCSTWGSGLDTSEAHNLLKTNMACQACVALRAMGISVMSRSPIETLL